MQQNSAPRSVTTYVHYTGPSSATTRTTATSTPAPIQQQPTTVAPKDVTFKAIIHSPKPRPAPQPVSSHNSVPTTSQPAPSSVTGPVTAARPTSTNATTSASASAAPPSSVPTTSTAPASATSTAPANSVIAQGDWTKDLVQLAKTAELKKHALTLQLQTAHILSAHAMLNEKNRAIQDVKEQRHKLESERSRLLESLRQVNEDRDKADITTSSIEKECTELRNKISQLSEGDYAASKRHVDQLRKELGQSPLPSLQSILDEKSAQYLNERRLAATATPSISTEVNANNKRVAPPPPAPALTSTAPPQSATTFAVIGVDAPPAKRPRGRPKGSKNRKSSG